jgi:hypothetical protein
MATDLSMPEEKTPEVNPGNYSPVSVNNKDTVGAVFLGILAVILLLGWVRAEARIRELLVKTANGTP